MKDKIFGALTGLAVAIGVLLVAPSAAQAVSWTTYANANYSPNSVRQSGAGLVYQNRGRIYAPASGVGYMQQFRVLVNVTKGAIVANTSGETGYWLYQSVASPVSNTVARCQLNGPASGSGHYLCDVYK